MNNSLYAAEQILIQLTDKGFITAYPYDRTQLKTDIANIINATMLTNVSIESTTYTRSSNNITQTFYI
jgi:hypothetical protein